MKNMSEKIAELQKDVAELEEFVKQSTRPRVKDILSLDIRRIVSEIVKIESEQKLQTTPTPIQGSSVEGPSMNTTRYEVKLNNYAWDQTDKLVKFYVTLKNVHTIPSENVSCQFTPKSLEMHVKDLNGKDYILRITNLLNPIEPEKSSWKVKNDMVILSLSKKSSEHWSHVTEWEKKSSDSNKPSLDTDQMDPSEGLMSLMKNMYEKGDDEMKRTIAKAWTESQMKGSQI